MRLNDKMELIENSLIRQILNGATERYAELVQLHENAVFALIVRIVGNSEEAEELTQDIFLKAYTKLSTFGGRSTFSTWLYRIACNEALSAVRRHRKDFSLFDFSRAERLPDAPDEEELSALTEAQEEALLAALDRLAPDERALVQLHYYENRPLSECGEILSISESNAKVRLHRIRKKLGLWISEKQ